MRTQTYPGIAVILPNGADAAEKALEPIGCFVHPVPCVGIDDNPRPYESALGRAGDAIRAVVLDYGYLCKGAYFPHGTFPFAESLLARGIDTFIVTPTEKGRMPAQKAAHLWWASARAEAHGQEFRGLKRIAEFDMQYFYIENGKPYENGGGDASYERRVHLQNEFVIFSERDWPSIIAKVADTLDSQQQKAA